MIKCSSSFIYSPKSILPHTLNITPYPPQIPLSPLPIKCQCGFYDNIYNTRMVGEFVCCNCGRIIKCNNAPSTPTTVTATSTPTTIKRRYIFVISLLLEIAACKEMILMAIESISQQGYDISCVFFDDNNIYVLKKGNRISLEIISDIQHETDFIIPLESMFLPSEFVKNESHNFMNSLPFFELSKVSDDIRGWAKTITLLNKICCPGVELVSFLNTCAKSLPSFFECHSPLHIVFPDKYQADLYPILLDLVRTNGGSIHAWDRHTEPTRQPSIETLINEMTIPRTNGGNIQIRVPPQIKVVDTTIHKRQILPLQKNINFKLPPTTPKSNFNISLQFKKKKNSSKTKLYLQLCYTDSMHYNASFNFTVIETLCLNLAPSLVDYYSSMNIGASVQSILYHKPNEYDLKKQLKHYLLAFSTPHHQFLTFLKVINYLLNSPLYSKSNPHLSSIYQHTLMDYDPFYLTSIYIPVIYLFETIHSKPIPTHVPMKKTSIQNLHGEAIVFFGFNKIIVVSECKTILVDDNEVKLFVDTFKSHPQFPIISNVLLINSVDSEVLSYCMLDDILQTTFVAFISEMNMIK